MIPKTIHYCWYGRGKFSPEIEMCIASWRKHCSDYEIKEWNEDNSPLDIPWIRDAYKHRKYAFVADYMRFYALYNEGGVYMDTDMLLVRPIDVFLQDRLFLGREDAYNANMAILGAEKGDSFCRQCLEYYDNTKFDAVSPPIITRFVTPQLFQYGFVEEDVTQQLTNGLKVYQSSYYYPIHYSQEFALKDVMKYAKPDTCGIHLWNKSWTDELQLLSRGDYKQGFGMAWKHIKKTPLLPLRYYKKLAKYLVYWITGK